MKPKNDLPQFSGLRGIAALLVLFFHVRTPQHTELDFGAFDSFSKFGYLGVDAFFVLSGYILSHVYRDNFATGLRASVLRSYGVARFARIYPLHLASLLLMLGAYFVALRMGVRPTEDAGYTWRGIILGLLLVHEWFGAIAPNPSSWSISIELANYILFPFLMLLPRAPRLLPIIGIVVGAVIVETFAGHRVLRSVIEFLMGACVYGSSASCDMKSLPRVAGVTFALPFVAAGWLGRELSGLAAFSFTTTMFFLGRVKRDPFSRFCSWQPVAFLGEISYSIYLLQWFIWVGWKHGMARFTFFGSHPYLLSLCAAASVIICAIPSFYFFERPFRATLRRMLERRVPGVDDVQSFASRSTF